MGQAFSEDDEVEYSEDKWIVRLCYNIKDHLPDGIEVVPSFQYCQNFSKFQEIISSTPKNGFYFFEL